MTKGLFVALPAPAVLYLFEELQVHCSCISMYSVCLSAFGSNVPIFAM